MQQINQAVVDQAITFTNRVALELNLQGQEHAPDRARLFDTMLNYLVYGPPNGDNADNKENNTDGK